MSRPKLAPRPCGSCPYRVGVPSGIWDESEYRKLPQYDEETHAQPTQAFFCHKADGNLCAGWVACHDMEENLGIRLASSFQVIDWPTFTAAMNYETDVPLFASGQEACDHGLAEIENPSDEAVEVIQRIVKLHQHRGSSSERGST